MLAVPADFRSSQTADPPESIPSSAYMSYFTMSLCCRFSWATQITTAQRRTSLTLPSSPSTSESSLWFAAGPARCAWSWWAVSSTVNTQKNMQHTSSSADNNAGWRIHLICSFSLRELSPEDSASVSPCLFLLAVAVLTSIMTVKVFIEST